MSEYVPARKEIDAVTVSCRLKILFLHSAEKDKSFFSEEEFLNFKTIFSEHPWRSENTRKTALEIFSNHQRDITKELIYTLIKKSIILEMDSSVVFFLCEILTLFDFTI